MSYSVSPALERFGMALLATRIMRLEQRGLMTGAARSVCSTHALPIDWTERRPLMDAFRRNLGAALQGAGGLARW